MRRHISSTNKEEKVVVTKRGVHLTDIEKKHIASTHPTDDRHAN